MKATKMSFRTFGDSVITYESDVWNGELLDTKVIINEKIICCIAGNTLEEFHKTLVETVDKYRI